MPGSVFKIVTADRRPRLGLDRRRRRRSRARRRRSGRASSSTASGSASTPACPARTFDLVERDGGARRTSGSRWPASRPAATTSWSTPSKLGFGAPIPFDLPTAVSQVTERQRLRAGRLRRRRRARQRVVRPGRDVRHAAPDGARGRDGGERRRADAAATRHGADRQGGHPHDRARSRSGASSRRPTPTRSPRRCSRRSRATSAGSSRPAPKVPGIPTAGKSGTAELGGSGRAALVVHRVRPGRTTRRSRSRSSSSAGAGRGTGGAARGLAHEGIFRYRGAMSDQRSGEPVAEPTGRRRRRQ